MVGGGLLGDHQRLPNLAVGESPRGELRYLALARGEARCAQPGGTCRGESGGRALERKDRGLLQGQQAALSAGTRERGGGQAAPRPSMPALEIGTVRGPERRAQRLQGCLAGRKQPRRVGRSAVGRGDGSEADQALGHPPTLAKPAEQDERLREERRRPPRVPGGERDIAEVVHHVGLGAQAKLAVLIVAEATSLVAMDAAEAFFGVATLALALGLIVAGAAVAKAGRWSGWRRFCPLACGLYIPLVLLPSSALPGFAMNYAIGIWGVCWLLFGLALRVEAARRGPVRQQR